MDVAALEARLTRMERKLAELEAENQLLRAAGLEPKQGAKGGESLPRREVLKGAGYALGAVSLSLMGMQRAEATTGFMQYGSLLNDSGTAPTALGSISIVTLDLFNSSPPQDDPTVGRALVARSTAGHAVHAILRNPGSRGDGVNVEVDGTGHGVSVVKSGEFGHCVLGFQNSQVSLYAALAGVTKGAGPGLHGRGEGTGQGVWGEINDSSKTQAAVIGTTEGTGPAIEGRSVLGRGGVFRGKKAQIRLIASTATTKPATGSRGDLFVDSSGRLWYCKSGGLTTGWKQLA
jgi:hypothetical protein